MLRRAHRNSPFDKPLAAALGLSLVVLATMFGAAMFGASPCLADEPIDAEVMVRPPALEDGAAFDVGEAGKLLLRQSILERALEEGAHDEKVTKLIGKGRCRKLDRARFMLDLHATHLGRDPRDDPRFEDARDAVFSAWKKIQRERLEEALGLDAWWNRKRARLRRNLDSDDPAGKGRGGQGEVEKAWSLRVSPRFSSDSVGVRLRLRGTGNSLLDGMSFRYTYEMDESYPRFILRFEDRMRYFDVNFAPDTPEFGDRLGISLRYSW